MKCFTADVRRDWFMEFSNRLRRLGYDFSYTYEEFMKATEDKEGSKNEWN